MLEVNFHGLDEIGQEELVYVVIAARCKGKWVMVRHNQRSTWEIPGGHREDFENAGDAARRELFEETGAVTFDLRPVCAYSVSDRNKQTYGMLFFAEIEEMKDLPESEIAEVRLVDRLLDDLTYPLIQPILFDKVVGFLEGMGR